jgi:hypothetical protein
MKRQITLSLLFFSFALSLAAQPASQTATDDTIALVIVSRGAVEQSIDGKKWIPARRGEDLIAGQRVRTGTGAFCILRFDDGSIFRVDAGTDLKLKGDFEENGTTVSEVEILKGAFAYDVKAKPTEPFRFKSPTATASIKGTNGTFETDGDVAHFTIEGSENQNEAAEFITSDGLRQVVRIGEGAFRDARGTLTRRRLKSNERSAIRERVGTLRDDFDREFKDMIQQNPKLKERADSMRERRRAKRKR